MAAPRYCDLLIMGDVCRWFVCAWGGPAHCTVVNLAGVFPWLGVFGSSGALWEGSKCFLISASLLHSAILCGWAGGGVATIPNWGQSVFCHWWGFGAGGGSLSVIRIFTPSPLGDL